MLPQKFLKWLENSKVIVLLFVTSSLLSLQVVYHFYLLPLFARLPTIFFLPFSFLAVPPSLPSPSSFCSSFSSFSFLFFLFLLFLRLPYKGTSFRNVDKWPKKSIIEFEEEEKFMTLKEEQLEEFNLNIVII